MYSLHFSISYLQIYLKKQNIFHHVNGAAAILIFRW